MMSACVSACTGAHRAAMASAAIPFFIDHPLEALQTFFFSYRRSLSADQAVDQPACAIGDGKRQREDGCVARHPLRDVVVIHPALGEVAGGEERDRRDDDACEQAASACSTRASPGK